MKIGLRVIKTAVSIMISIMIARLLHLEPDHFAGIISMLAVQPSVYRSLRHSAANLASALLSAMLGITAVELFGDGAPVIAAVALLVMTLHVRFRQTAALPLAVIVAVNTMGTADQLFDMAALHQISLVLIGMTVGTVVNTVLRPIHREREEVLLAKSESMLRALLHYVSFDLQNGSMTPYKPHMRQQLDEVRGYIENGQAVSQLIREDRWLARKSDPGAGAEFRACETMLERIRDVIKALQKADLQHPEARRLHKALALVIRQQERMLHAGRSFSFRLLHEALHIDERRTANRAAVQDLFPYYLAYEALREYVSELVSLRRQIVVREAGTLASALTYSSVRPQTPAAAATNRPL